MQGDRLLVSGRLEAVRAALARRERVVGGVVAPERGGELRLEGALLRHLVGVGVRVRGEGEDEGEGEGEGEG